jgi:cyclase
MAIKMLYEPRMIPCLLLKGQGLYKTIKFSNPVYLGDPLNIVRIFNDKEVDELCILDIKATLENRGPNFDYLSKITSECFMPLSYGGGITSLEDCKRLFSIGLEKIIINTSFFSNPSIIEKAASEFGSQSIVISIDVKKTFLSTYQVWSHCGTVNKHLDPAFVAKKAENCGAGEIIINSIDKDGTMSGYDEKLISLVNKSISIPTIACGGAKNLENMVDIIKKTNVSAVAAGALFVFYGPLRGVLINPPTHKQFKLALNLK